MALKAVIHADVFDGRHEDLKKDQTVILEDNKVREITGDEVNTENFEEVIDAEGKTVIPGLTDAHIHIAHSPFGRDSYREDEIAIGGTVNARKVLMKGFTTIRDAGGITYGLKRSIDAGVIDGPRIYPSNAFLSTTCGHGDFRTSRAEYRITDGVYASPGIMNHERAIVDGVPEAIRAVRQNFFLGSSQIKIMAGGGVMSLADPIATVQFTLEEMKAIVGAAADYGTYVMAHLYTPGSIRRAAEAGVKSFEHCQLMDEESAKLIQNAGAFIDPCPNMAKRPPDIIWNDPVRKAKQQYAAKGEILQTELINKYDLPLLFGTDSTDGDLEDFRHYKERFGSYRTLVAATGNVNDLIQLTTYQNPYPDGKIGVLEEGAFADLLVVKGNPVEDADLLSDENNIQVIIKDGTIYKDTLQVK